MKSLVSRIVLLLLFCTLFNIPGIASAYNAQPKLVLILIIDQFRADYLERAYDQFSPNGFRMLMDRGAWFSSCYYDYANTLTAPGHATLLTGSYSSGHGIFTNEWWDPTKKKVVAAVADDTTRIVGVAGGGAGASPRNLLTDTLGDELKLATDGKARVFTTSLKDRSAVFTAGFSADGAYWMDPKTGAWVTSSFYRDTLPDWVQRFNAEKRAEKYWNREWKDASGRVLRNTNRTANGDFTEIVGATPYGIDYQFEFARELITNEKLGSGPATDLLVISLSEQDLIGHKLGPNAPEVQQFLIETDRRLADFFAFLGRQIGLANVWIAFSADHGISPLPEFAQKLRLPASQFGNAELRSKVNAALAGRLSGGRPADYVAEMQWPRVFLSADAFAPLKISEADAERTVGETLLQFGMRTYFTKSQLARGDAPPSALGRRYLNSYSPHSGWYVLGVPQAFKIPASSGATHGSPFRYDAHVPLAFYGLPFRAGQYRTAAEPVDLAVTLASLLGINPPAAAQGRVLTEALASPPAQNAAENRDAAHADSKPGATR